MRDSKRFDDVTVLNVPGRGIRSKSMWTGLRAVKRPSLPCLTMMMNGSQITSIILWKYSSKIRVLTLSTRGAIRHDEEHHSPELHPRLRRSDGTLSDEHRALIFCDAFDISRFLKWENVILSHSFVARSELLTADVLDDPKLEVMEDVYLYLLVYGPWCQICL